MGQSWNLSGRTALATLAGLAVLEGFGGPVWAGPKAGRAASAPAAATASAPGRVSVDFVEADLGDIVKALSVQSGVNVAVASGVKGKVTVRLKGTTLDDALRLISRLANVDYKRINGTYVVGSTEDLKSLAVRSGVMKTVVPKYLSLSEAKDVAQGAGPYVTVEARDQSGQLVLRGLAEDLATVQAAVDAADIASTAPRTVITPARLRPKALAEILLKAVPEVKCNVQERSLIVAGSRQDLALALDVARSADASGGVPVTRIYKLKYLNPGQAAALFARPKDATVVRETVVGGTGTLTGPTETTPSIAGQFPFLSVVPGPEMVTPPSPSFKPLSLDSSKSFSTAAGAPAESASTGAGPAANTGSSKTRTLVLVGPEDEVAGATALIEQVDVAPPQVMIEARVVESSPETLKNIGLQWDFGTLNVSEKPSKGFEFGTFGHAGLNFTAAINAAVENRSAKVLAEPKIAVIDGEDASIFIGDTFRYRVLSSITTGGQQVFDIKEVPVGIVLLCRPRVSTDGLVTLKVNPVVSTITSFVGPERIPQTASREANSTIRVKDGETVAIGGLIRNEDRQTIQKVPFLGDLPLVGQLFRNNSHEKRRTDVTIFLTTHLLKG